MSAPQDLRSFVDELRGADELVEIEAEVSPDLELAEIHRRVIAAGGPALLFRKVAGCAFPLVTNLFGTAKRVERAFGRRPEELVRRAAALPDELLPPSLGKLWQQRDLMGSLLKVGTKTRRAGPICEVVERPPQLGRIPGLQTWPRDGGRFLTLPLVYTEPPGGGPPNLGMYRIQLYSETQTGLHCQIGKGGGFHLAEAEERGEALPVNVHVGGPPAAILGAIAPLPEGVPELLLASLALGERLPLAQNPAGPLPLLAKAELALVGAVEPGARHPEGPFGDHYGYYSELHDYPLLDVHALVRRADPIVPATVVGKPRQEDFFLGDYLQELLSPLFPRVMPGVKDLWSYGETGYHSLAGAVVRERYEREAMAHAFRILGEGQLSLTKFLLLTDGNVDLRDFKATLMHVLARADFRTDLFLFANLSMDSLDYAGPRINRGGKGVLLGTGDPVRELPGSYSGSASALVRDVRVYCPGVLVVETAPQAEAPDAPALVAADPAFADWPLVVLSDEAERAVRSTANFLWTTFTRFDPAADITAREVRLVHNHASMTAPIVLDARMRPGYPEELFCDEETAALVGKRWNEYFPAGQEMGDSDRGHLD